MPKRKIILTKTAASQLETLDKPIVKRILKYLHERLESAPEPRKLGVYLIDTDGLYRFRIGDYRLITHIDDSTMQILVLAVGHRRDVYKKNL